MHEKPARNASQPLSSSENDRQSIVVSALIFAGGTLASRVLGLLRDMMTARYFSNDVRDAFIAAFRLPNLFRRIMGEGTLSVSFVPVFVEIVSGKGSVNKTDAELRARELVAGVFGILMSIAMTVSVLAIIFMDDILRVLLSGEAYMSVPGKFELTVKLARIMFSFLIFISAFGLFMAILNGLRKFAWTALAPCFFNLALIAGLVFSQKMIAPEVVVAWAVLLGGALQAGVLVPGIIRSGYFPHPAFKWNSPDVIRVLKALGPSMIAMGVMQLFIIVNMFFASRLQSGSQSYLYLADRILELPLSLFVVSVGAALLPTLARNWSDGDVGAMGDTINHYLRLILFVALPAAIGMFVLAHPIVDVLFLGREFKYADSVATAQIIQIYAFTLMVAASVRVLAQGFYAIQNTWYPALAAAVALVSHVIFAFALTRTFGLNGLAAASLFSSTVNMIMLATAYNRWVGSGLHLRNLLLSFAKFIVCGAAMVAALQVYDLILRQVTGRFFPRAAALAITILIGGSVYMLCAHLLKIAEYRETVSTFTSRVRSRMKR